MNNLLKRAHSPVLLLLSFLIVASCYNQKEDEKINRPVVIGYVGGFHGLLDTERIQVEKLTHINYAFVNIVDGKAFLTNEKTDSINFRKLNELKLKNRELKILISIGGWAWSENFSDAVLTDSSRKVFAKTSVDIIRKYDLDGVDIDWEYPGMEGEEGNVFRPEDKENYTLMFAALREELDQMEKETGSPKLLTTAVAGFGEYLQHTDMKMAASYLDYVNLMTYDLFVPDISVHHAGLYASDGYDSNKNADHCVKAFIAAGVPVEKLVMGLPFYGRSFTVESHATQVVGQPYSAKSYIDGYGYIKDSLVNQRGFQAFRDDRARVPYIYNAETGQMISYDDEQSVEEKCNYVLKNKMAGVMFWEYDSDPKGYLLGAIHDTFN
ncbi:glycoside hydrolase family 18 protein [Dyadobacter tibetensis]|uniref:glycoside hydrolase family 18 protein n=1 Tax=Dyadobacter tibetensis TaxID=1211851 RepID=UPI00046F51DD|nr:glycoside hydrolase family 18 protein [Dyadobacter tibetensis]